MKIKSPEDNMDLPEWVQWLAQDADGAWWAYEAEPHQHHQGWYENEVGHRLKFKVGKANSNWQTSLRRYPQ